MATSWAYTSTTIRIPSGNMDANLASVASEGSVPPSSYITHMPRAPSEDVETLSMDRKLPFPSSHVAPFRNSSVSFPEAAPSSPREAAAPMTRGSITASALDPSLVLILHPSPRSIRYEG